MERISQLRNKGKKAGRQFLDLGFQLGMHWSRRCGLTICVFTLAWFPMICVEMVAAHPGLDPDIDEITHELEKNPKNVDLLIKRGQIYRFNGELTDSLNDLDRAEELAPDNRRIILERGFTLSALGRDRDAEVALDQYLEQASGRTRLDALAERAHIHARTGQADLAIADFTSAISLHPTMALYLARGELHESLGHLEEAASGYREGLSRLGNSILLKKGLIRVETSRKRYDEVLTLINDELDRASVKTEWHLRRAEVLAAMGKDQAAQSAHEQALEESNRVLGKRVTATHLVTRAKVYISMGRLGQARQELQLAVQKAPNFAAAQELLKNVEADYQATLNKDPGEQNDQKN
jgi:tetratricopeptide (TPR) repeat protein